MTRTAVRVSKLATRGAAIVIWLTIGGTLGFGLREVRADEIVPIIMLLGMAALWLLMPFALGPIIWDVTEELPKTPK